MADFTGSGFSGLSVAKTDTGLKLDDLAQIPMGDKKGSGTRDPLADLAKEAKRARRQAQASGLAVTPGGPGGANIFTFGITEAGGVALEQTNVGRLLQLAKQTLSTGKCREALENVTELLRDQPGHPEGLYLKAVCHCELGEPRAGLRALAELRAVQEGGAEVKPLLASSANDVRFKLRAAILPTVFSENVDRLREGSWEAVVTDTDELIGLDPGVWEFHYLRADGHSYGGKLDEAWEGVATAFGVAAPKQPESLVNLREQVRGRLAMVKMAPALEHYKKRQYAAARAAVADLDAEFRPAKIVTLFDDYLALLEASPGKSPQTVAPVGPIADTDQLHFFLTRDEMPLLRLMRQMERYELAVPQAREALQYAPHFPYLHYLTALSLYQELMARFRTDDPPSLDEAEVVTHEARGHAVASQADPELGDAPEVVAVLDRLLITINEIREEQKKWKVDWAILEPIADRYLALMKGASEGIEGVAHHERLTQGMNSILRQLAPLAGTQISKDGKDMHERITGAANHAIQQLGEIRQAIVEGEQVNKLWERLSNQVDRVKGGYVTQSTIYSFRSALQTIQSEAQALRRRLTVPEKVKSVDDLIRTVIDILWKING